MTMYILNVLRCAKPYADFQLRLLAGCAVLAVTAAMLSSLAAFAQSVVPPSISPTGAFASPQTVTMSAPSGTIYYSLDGSQPSNLSNQYTGGITISQPTQINAVVYYQPNMSSTAVYSPVSTVFVDVDPTLSPVLQSDLAPPVGPAPILWLKSDFAVTTGAGSPPQVVSWADLSGSGAFSTSFNNPTLVNAINDLNAISLNGGAQYLTLPALSSSAFSSGVSIFIVTRPLSVSSSRLIDFGSGATGNDVFIQTLSSGGFQFGVSVGTGPTFAQSPSSLDLNHYQLLETVLTPGSSAATATCYINGVAGATNTSMNNIPSVARASNFLGQASNASGSNNYQGNICEAIVFPSLTPAQRTTIESFLLQKYQIPAPFPSVATQTPRAPILSLDSGTLSGPTQVAISEQIGASTRFTTDGTTPTLYSNLYTGVPISVNYTQTINAISFLNGNASAMTSKFYTLDSNIWPAPNPSDMSTPSINLQLPAPSN